MSASKNATGVILDRLERKAITVSHRLGEIGIVLCLFLTPLLLGGRHDLGRFVYVLAAAIAAIGMLSATVLSRRRVDLPPMLMVTLGGAICLLALQITPVPIAWIHALGPDLSSVMPLWSGSAGFGEWPIFSLSPSATRQGLAILIAHGLLLVALLIRLQTQEDVQTLLRYLAYGSVVMTLIAIWQYLSGSDRLLGFYASPHRDFSTHLQGTFTNKNHFAHYLVLMFGPVAWLATTGRNKASSNPHKTSRGEVLHGYLGLGMLALLLVVVLATQSRGGIVAFAVACSVAMAFVWRHGRVRLPQLAAIGAVVLLAIAGVSLAGYERIADRMSGLMFAELDVLDTRHARRSIWEANIEAFTASPVVGFGVGSHRDVYPHFIDRWFPNEFTHAESGFLQVASETGLVGLGLLSATIIWLALTLWRGVRASPETDLSMTWLAIVPGLFASLAHSVVDFVWYLPGLFGITLALIASGIRLSQIATGSLTSDEIAPAEGQNRSAFSYSWAGVGAMLGFFAIGTAWGPAAASSDWDAYLRMSRSLRGVAERLVRDDPDDVDSMLDQTIAYSNGVMVSRLEAVVSKNPRDARARYRLASRLLQRYALSVDTVENGMPLELVSDAAENGGFGSDGERQAWINRALGHRADLLRLARYHSEAAVKLAPLQGEAYLRLADLAFLEPNSPSVVDLVNQAVATRPHDGDILFEAGRHLSLAGESDRGLSLWKTAIRTPGSHLPQLVAMLVQTIPAATFVEEFDPGSRALDLALPLYRRLGNHGDLEVLCDRAVEEVRRLTQAGEMPPSRLAYRWRHASETLRSLGRYEEAVECAMQAVNMAPSVLTMQLELATALHRAERYEEADTPIRWCLARRPDIRYLQDWLAVAESERHERPDRRASQPARLANRASISSPEKASDEDPE